MVVIVGDTDNVTPLPAKIPPHEPEYQYQFAPVPRYPPDKVIVDDEPEQILFGVAVAEFAEIEFDPTMIVALAHVVVLQLLIAFT